MPVPLFLRAGEELCEDTIGPLEAVLDEATGEVVIDASAVRLLGAAGMRVLVRARNRLTAEGGSLRVVRVSPFVRRTLEVVGLNDLLGEPVR